MHGLQPDGCLSINTLHNLPWLVASNTALRLPPPRKSACVRAHTSYISAESQRAQWPRHSTGSKFSRHQSLVLANASYVYCACASLSLLGRVQFTPPPVADIAIPLEKKEILAPCHIQCGRFARQRTPRVPDTRLGAISKKKIIQMAMSRGKTFLQHTTTMAKMTATPCSARVVTIVAWVAAATAAVSSGEC